MAGSSATLWKRGMPFSADFNGAIARSSEGIWDGLEIELFTTRCGETVGQGNATNRRFLFGVSGEILFDLPALDIWRNDENKAVGKMTSTHFDALLGRLGLSLACIENVIR
jgi:hypothetical protein